MGKVKFFTLSTPTITLPVCEKPLDTTVTVVFHFNPLIILPKYRDIIFEPSE